MVELTRVVSPVSSGSPLLVSPGVVDVLVVVVAPGSIVVAVAVVSAGGSPVASVCEGPVAPVLASPVAPPVLGCSGSVALAVVMLVLPVALSPASELGGTLL